MSSLSGKNQTSVALSSAERAHLSKRRVQRRSHPIIAVHKERVKGRKKEKKINSCTLNAAEARFSSDECHLTQQYRESLCVSADPESPLCLDECRSQGEPWLDEFFKPEQHVFLDKLFKSKQWYLKPRLQFGGIVLLQNLFFFVGFRFKKDARLLTTCPISIHFKIRFVSPSTQTSHLHWVFELAD